MMGNYVAGTAVTLEAEFRHPDTDVREDPPDVELTVLEPGLPPLVLRYSDDQIVRTGLGLYAAVVIADTPGEWRYQFKGTGAGAVVVHGRFSIRDDL
jgi:hypothetical protein